jgi:lysophospholipase L1-like esterase
MKNIKLLLVIITLMMTFFLSYSEDANAPSLENAVKFFTDGKNSEGVIELTRILSITPSSPEALDLWIKKGEAYYASIDYKLSYFTPKNDEETKTVAELTAVRDKVRENLKKAGFKVVRIYLVGDSTMQDYTIRPDYQTKYYPMSGWGESFQERVSYNNLLMMKKVIDADTAVVINKGKGGRSTRNYWEEGSWKAVYEILEPDDYVLIQFGHNDSSVSNKDRYVDIPGYKKFLTQYVKQTREKKAFPILITPVNRNYPWDGNNKLENVHGEYPEAMRQTALKLNVPLIDLNKRSLDFFGGKGRDFVTKNYFIPTNVFPNYKSKGDNTHFQVNGAIEVSRLVYEGMVDLASEKK